MGGFMKRSILFLIILIVLALLTTDLGLAQATIGNGVLGINLSNAGRLRMGPSPWATSTRQVDRITPIVALSKNAVFDYNENANGTSYTAKAIVVPGVDTAARVVCDNSFAPVLPPNVHVQVTVYTWKSAKYLIYQYRVYNDSNIALPFYVSSHTLPMPSTTYGGETIVYNSSKSTCYYYRTGAPVYVSQKLLSKNLYGLRILDWDTYSSDPNSEIMTDSTRFLIATYAKFDTLLTAGVDGSIFEMNAGLFNLKAKDSADVYYGLGLGTTAVEAIALMDSAQARYSKLVTSVERTRAIVPANFALEQNYPNPFNPSTQIKFKLPARSNVTLTVFDALGRSIRTLLNQQLDAGEYMTTFDATGLSSGVYYYVLKAGSRVETKKMVLIR
jgi:hypothetical protein